MNYGCPHWPDKAEIQSKTKLNVKQLRAVQAESRTAAQLEQNRGQSR